MPVKKPIKEFANIRMPVNEPMHGVFPKKVIFREFTSRATRSPSQILMGRERRKELMGLIDEATEKCFDETKRQRNRNMFLEYYGFILGEAGNYSYLAEKYGVSRTTSAQIIGKMKIYLNHRHRKRIAEMYGINEDAILRRYIKALPASK